MYSIKNSTYRTDERLNIADLNTYTTANRYLYNMYRHTHIIMIYMYVLMSLIYINLNEAVPQKSPMAREIIDGPSYVLYHNSGIGDTRLKCLLGVYY